jgi:hypothetical protein
MEMNLENRMGEKAKEFSIFYGLLIEIPLNGKTIAQISAKIEEIEFLHSEEEQKLENLRKQALLSGKESDLLELSKNQLIFDNFSKGCYNQIELLVVKIQEIEEAIKLKDAPSQNTRSKTAPPPVAPKPKTVPPPVAPKPKTVPPPVAPKPKTVPPPVAPKPKTVPPPVAPRPAQPPIAPIQSPTFKDVKDKFGLFVVNIIAYYAAFCAPKTDFHLVKETISIKGNKITVDTSDVRGDGACGFRAILTSFLQKSGINLSFAPSGMERFILDLKQCMFELLTVLSTEEDNYAFVNGLLHNRDNGSPKANIAEWFEMVTLNSYYCTDGDIRLIAILFGMLSERDQITQINVLKLRPTKHNSYQSFNCYGTPYIVLPSVQEHINIIHTGGHFRSVTNFHGILPAIEGIDSVIILPHPNPL